MRRLSAMAAGSGLSLLLGTAAAFALEGAQSATILGPTNALLADGSAALEAGRVEEGIRLTLEGLKIPSSNHDLAAGHSNICAGYASLKRWDDALSHCNRALELDRGNWRTYNNRAAVFTGKRLYELAVADINAGLELAPNSQTLKTSREIIEHNKRVHRDRQRRGVKA
jgi:tetratricopeptide (TPR) repeat protein